MPYPAAPRKTRLAALLFLLGGTLSAPSMACSSCGCTLSSDWDSQGFSNTPGLRVDVRYDYIDQDQLRHGSNTANGTAVAAAQAAGTLGETERKTTNHYLTVGVDYTFNRAWGINLTLPYIDRDHQTIAFDNANPGALDNTASSSHTRELGDIKIVGRYQGFSPDGDIGLLFGVKLPTGETKENFAAGPLAQNVPPEKLDRSLQAGTGSTDLILGLFRTGSLNRSWDWFAQALYQHAFRTKDDFKPGDSLNLNAGVRYMEWGDVVPQLQINAKTSPHDRGANSDPYNSGGQVVYLSPGLTVALTKSTKVYGFVQVPLYQHVEGFQLAPHWNASIGAQFAF